MIELAQKIDEYIQKGYRVIFLLGHEPEIKAQALIKYAMEYEYKLSQWTYMKADDTSSDPICDELHKLLAMPNDTPFTIYFFEVMSYRNLSDDTLQVLAETQPDKWPGIVIFNIGAHDNAYSLEDDFLSHVGAVLQQENVGYIKHELPGYVKRLNILQGALNSKGLDAILQQAALEDGDELIKNVANITEGLGNTQVVLPLAFSLLARNGKVDLDIIEKKAEHMRIFNQGKEPPHLFMDAIYDAKDSFHEWIDNRHIEGVPVFAHYFLFMILCHLNARWHTLHFITGGDYSPLLDSFVYLLSDFDNYNRPIVKYNAQQGEVTEVISPLPSDPFWVVQSVHDLIDENKGYIPPLAMLEWFRNIERDNFILYMQDYSAETEREHAILQFISEVDRASYKNLITTHKERPLTKYMVGITPTCFRLPGVGP